MFLPIAPSNTDYSRRELGLRFTTCSRHCTLLYTLYQMSKAIRLKTTSLLLKDYCFKYCGALQTVMTETHWAELRPNIFVHCLLPELAINVKDARQMRSAETNVYAASFTRIPWLSKYTVALHPYRSTHTVEMTIWKVCVKIECILLHCTQPNPGREKNGKRL